MAFTAPKILNKIYFPKLPQHLQIIIISLENDAEKSREIG